MASVYGYNSYSPYTQPQQRRQASPWDRRYFATNPFTTTPGEVRRRAQPNPWQGSTPGTQSEAYQKIRNKAYTDAIAFHDQNHQNVYRQAPVEDVAPSSLIEDPQKKKAIGFDPSAGSGGYAGTPEPPAAAASAAAVFTGRSGPPGPDPYDFYGGAAMPSFPGTTEDRRFGVQPDAPQLPLAQTPDLMKSAEPQRVADVGKTVPSFAPPPQRMADLSKFTPTFESMVAQRSPDMAKAYFDAYNQVLANYANVPFYAPYEQMTGRGF